MPNEDLNIGKEEKLSLTEKFIEWCNKDTEAARFERTIFQGVISAVITVLPQVLSGLYLNEWLSAFIMAMIMAILAPVQKAIGSKAAGNLENLNE